jgi:hypothetical protein
MMRFKRLFDIAGEPPSNNMIEAAKRSTQKRFWTALLVSAGLLAIGCLMLDAWFTPPLALLVSILVSGAAYMAYLFVLEGMELNEASNDDVSGLLLRLNEARGAASLSVESSYIQQVSGSRATILQVRVVLVGQRYSVAIPRGSQC